MQYEIKIEAVLTGVKGGDWDNEITSQLIKNYLEANLLYLPWFRNNIQTVIVKNVEVKLLEGG